MSLDSFLKEHTLSPGFITSMCFKKSTWDRGLAVDTRSHYGYEFLGIIYSGIKGMDCVYSDFPLVIQRMPFKRSWLDKWALFALVGVPQLYKDLELWGLCEDAVHVWDKMENRSLKGYIKSLLNASAYKKIYIPLCGKIASYQKSYFRKVLAYLIIYLSPPCVYQISRKLVFR